MATNKTILPFMLSCVESLYTTPYWDKNHSNLICNPRSAQSKEIGVWKQSTPQTKTNNKNCIHPKTWDIPRRFLLQFRIHIPFHSNTRRLILPKESHHNNSTQLYPLIVIAPSIENEVRAVISFPRSTWYWQYKFDMIQIPPPWQRAGPWSFRI